MGNAPRSGYFSHAIAAFLMLALLGGCARSDRLVIFADPWLGEFPQRAVEAYQAIHPETEIELRLLSSEVVAQRLHHGDPIDVFLCLRPEIMRERGLSDRVAGEVALADLDLVQAMTLPEWHQPELGALDCWSVPADGRPLRRYLSNWEEVPEAVCILTADFCRQAQDYPLRGWVARSYLPGFFVRKHRDRLAIFKQGPNFPGAFTAIRLKDAPHDAQADLFMEFLRSEKCKTLLAEENIID